MSSILYIWYVCECVCSCVCDCGRPILESLQIWKQTPESSRISLKDPNSSQMPMTSRWHNLLQATVSFKRSNIDFRPNIYWNIADLWRRKWRNSLETRRGLQTFAHPLLQQYFWQNLKTKQNKKTPNLFSEQIWLLSVFVVVRLIHWCCFRFGLIVEKVIHHIRFPKVITLTWLVCNKHQSITEISTIWIHLLVLFYYSQTNELLLYFL